MTTAVQPSMPIAGKGRDSVRSWPLPDLIAYGLCWITGLLLCLIAGGIVLFMLFKGFEPYAVHVLEE